MKPAVPFQYTRTMLILVRQKLSDVINLRHNVVKIRPIYKFERIIKIKWDAFLLE